jgi:RimJ/RimL family protein N-acetyltransferase
MDIAVAAGPELHSARLVLRRWRDSDRDPFAAMNRDPRVMEYFLRPHTDEESARLLERIETCFEQRGYGLWAVEPEGRGLAGFLGLWPVPDAMPFAPAVEVGWRLAPDFWGEGLATEAACAAVEYAFGELALGEVVSYTAAVNLRSQRVMQRLGMSSDEAEDFVHPEIEAGHRLSHHVLYRLAAEDWRLRPSAPSSTP